mmetsp:Transcript_7149/g.14099  ORF Transcript_7149/g.14099 Transcript_7149/m.14099 type:complete len:112 (-) Transcript_7149:153-488(-)
MSQLSNRIGMLLVLAIVIVLSCSTVFPSPSTSTTLLIGKLVWVVFGSSISSSHVDDEGDESNTTIVMTRVMPEEGTLKLLLRRDTILLVCCFPSRRHFPTLLYPILLSDFR